MMIEKRIAVITGAAAEIGRATLQAFVEAKWEVIGLDLQPVDDLPSDARLEQIDVASPVQVETFFGELGESHERLHALVNAAAIPLNKPLIETIPEDWDAALATSIRSIYLVSRNAFPLLKVAGGAIVNIGSEHPTAASNHAAAFAASKGGTLSLTRAMALEFGPEGVRVNAVLPGAVDTQMRPPEVLRAQPADAPAGQRAQELGRRSVLGRPGRPEEIAQAVLFLADARQASFITGQALIVDGGATARLSYA